MVVAQQTHEDANHENHNGFLPQHNEALGEVMTHQEMPPDGIDGNGDQGQNTSLGILLPAQNQNPSHSVLAEGATFSLDRNQQNYHLATFSHDRNLWNYLPAHMY